LETNTNKKKSEQLEIPIGTAQNKLRKSIMFFLIQKCGLDICYQCGEKIETVDDFSIEHKIPWMDSANPKELFYNIDNIAFSHLACNIKAGRNTRELQHGTEYAYFKAKCRCEKCLLARKTTIRKKRNDRNKKDYARSKLK